jgi:hypothetical protein
MLRRTSVAGLLTSLIVSNAALGDTYLPFQNFRTVEPTARYYLVVTKRPGGPQDPGRGTPVDYVIAERKPGSPPPISVCDGIRRDRHWDVVSNPEVKVRVGDIVHGRGNLDRAPRIILLSSTGFGFVGLDVQGYNYGLRQSGDAVVIVSQDGKVRHRKGLIDLFDEGDRPISPDRRGRLLARRGVDRREEA